MAKRKPMKQRIRVQKRGNKKVIEGEIVWKIAENPTVPRYIAVCPSLSITLQADSKHELFALIPDSMDSFFASLDKHGDWDAFFKELSWSREDRSALEDLRSKSPGIPPMRIESVVPHDLVPAGC